MIGLFKLIEVLLDDEWKHSMLGGMLQEKILNALVELNSNTLDKKEMIKCKSSSSRKAAFNCLLTLLTDKSNMQNFIKFI